MVCADKCVCMNICLSFCLHSSEPAIKVLKAVYMQEMKGKGSLYYTYTRAGKLLLGVGFFFELNIN